MPSLIVGTLGLPHGKIINPSCYSGHAFEKLTNAEVLAGYLP